MQAQTLNCPNCGAAISSDSPQCHYCESKLATIACPSCFAMMFIGSRYCPHCGAAPAEATAAPLSVLKCPRCKIDMTSITIGAEPMRECERCGGLWVEVVVGVVVDVCKGHGTWFDRDELREIVEFVRGGGLEVSRQREKTELEFQRGQLRAEQLAAATRADSLSRYYSEDDRVGGLSAAHGLLKFLIE